MERITRKEAILKGIALSSAALLGSRLRATASSATVSSPSTHRAHWLSGKWGLMTHWIAPGPGSETGHRITDLNAAVDAFDVPGFIRQFEATGAHHLIFTVGQNTTYYSSPNTVLDKYMGPGHAPRRDLVLEIAKGLHDIGKRFIAYLPAEVKNDPTMFDAFKWRPKDQHEFEQRYTEFIRAYSLQWGSYVDGWWYDGCYTYDDYYVPRNWQLWCDVSRAGNKHAAVAFNNGSFYSGFTQPMTPLQDYLSGECPGIRHGQIGLTDKHDPDRSIPPRRYAEGTKCQFHVLTPIDNHGNWINEKNGPLPPPKYSDEELFPFVRSCVKAGAGVTMNVGLYQDGRMGKETLEQLKRMTHHNLKSLPATDLFSHKG